MGEGTWAIFAGGGTAGHLLPGLATAGALVDRGRAPSTIHFIGSDRGVEAEMVPPGGYTLDELPGRGIQRRLTAANIAAAAGLVRATFAGIRIVGTRRPAVVVCLGGHASFAGGLGAIVYRIPLVLVEQNVRAGAVNRLFRRFAVAAAVTFAGTDLPRAVVTGNPLRLQVRARAEHPDRLGARAELGLPADRLVLAVYTGSQGSKRVNEAVRGLVTRWSARGDLAVRHVVGRRDFPDYAAAPLPLPADGLVYELVEYEDRVELLLDAADIAVTRAGAGTCSELTAFGVPAVMVPLPIATRDHQRANANALAAAGGAVVVPDAECDADRLETELTPLLADAAERERRSKAMASLGQLDAAERVADLVEANARKPRQP